MARTVEEHAHEVLTTHLESDKSRKYVVREARKIIDEGRYLALSEMIFEVQGSEHKGKREIYKVTRGVGSGPASCSCRAKEFSRDSCKHWLAVTAITIGTRRRKEELQAEHRELLRRADELLEEASYLGI